MNVHQTLRKLRSEKRWYDEVISTLEQIEHERTARVASIERPARLQIDSRHRRRLSQLMKAW